MRVLKIFLCLMVAAVISSGCALQEKEAQTLLARDHHAMSDPELERYYRRLNDQLAGMERKARRSGEDLQATAETSPLIIELRQRRNAVRSELSRRNLRP